MERRNHENTEKQSGSEIWEREKNQTLIPIWIVLFAFFFGFLLGVHMVEESSEKLTADSEMDIKSEWFWEEYSPVRRYIYNLALVVGGL